VAEFDMLERMLEEIKQKSLVTSSIWPVPETVG
jgi:hypothetical protein